MMRLNVKFSQSNQRLPVSFNSSKQTFSPGFGVVNVVTAQPDIYEGAYDVTPLITSQVLATNEKYMIDDVRIDMIPTREIQNPSGGVTFIVG